MVNGSAVPCRAAAAFPSELFSAYAITLDADRASSAATNYALQLAATDLEYEGTRVKSPVIGRDMNPMGRGDGTYYANGGNALGGSVTIYGARPPFIGEKAYGQGNGVNNLFTIFDWWDRIRMAQTICPLIIVTCPVFFISGEGDPCEGLDLSKPEVLCCKCIPLMCPDCFPCPFTKGCCIIKLPEWYEYCKKPTMKLCCVKTGATFPIKTVTINMPVKACEEVGDTDPCHYECFVESAGYRPVVIYSSKSCFEIGQARNEFWCNPDDEVPVGVHCRTVGEPLKRTCCSTGTSEVVSKVSEEFRGWTAADAGCIWQPVR
jgi:hypothetical protein